MKDISVKVVCMMGHCRRVIVDGPPHPGESRDLPALCRRVAPAGQGDAGRRGACAGPGGARVRGQLALMTVAQFAAWCRRRTGK